MKVLLDTDSVSELLRGRNPHIAQRVAAHRQSFGPPAVSAITVIEIVRGAFQAGTPQRADAFRRWVRSAKILPVERPIAWLAGEIAGRLNRAGQPIGFADVAIAATAIHHMRTLISGNTRHFARIVTLGFALSLDSWHAELPQG